MNKRFFIILLLFGMAGLACQVTSLSFLSTPTPIPTNTPIPTFTRTPEPTATRAPKTTSTLASSQGGFMAHMPECLVEHFGAGKDYAGWQPLFCDDFTYPGDWVVEDYSESPGTIRKKVLSDTGQLSWTVAAKVNNTFIDFIPVEPIYLSSFDISVREWKVDGPNSWFVIIFGYQEDTTMYYAFVVDHADQNSSVWLMENGQWNIINDWSMSTAIKKADEPDAWNTVSVIGEGTSYKCYVNGLLVQAFDDERLPAGWVGISVMADPDTTTTFLFDDIVLLGK